jgi:hypothetical protein
VLALVFLISKVTPAMPVMFDGIYFAVRYDENGDGKLTEDEVKEVSRVPSLNLPTLVHKAFTKFQFSLHLQI